MRSGHRPDVLVGYDGSAEGERALRWGVQEARLRRRRLTICHAWDWPYPEPPIDPAMIGIVQRMAEHVLDKGVRIAQRQAPGLEVDKRLVKGPVAGAILHEAVDTELIVIGVHGTGESTESPVGPAVFQVPAHALCPVVVHRSTEPDRRRVVIGVDGSRPSDAALAFGFEEAALRGWEVQAIYGARKPPPEGDIDPVAYTDVDDVRRCAGNTLERAVSPWREKYPRVSASTLLMLESPRQALLQAAEQAGLLVVGDRGTGGLPGLRLGSVALTMLQHGHCSVVITQAWRRD
jgi:nucleotide-binding universal stress UspA family protein